MQTNRLLVENYFALLKTNNTRYWTLIKLIYIIHDLKLWLLEIEGLGSFDGTAIANAKE